jgi:hypothetical protein
MSRLSERLGKVRKASGAIGFGFGSGRVDARRMLVVPVLDGVPSDDAAAQLRERADGVILQYIPGDGEAAFKAVEQAFPGMPVGLRLAGPDVDERLLGLALDFVMCGVDAPLGLLALTSTGLYVECDAGVESSRLRALADLGVEGIVLTSESLNLLSLSAAVECRRVRAMTGCPVLVKMLMPPSPEQITGLWKAGVDGVVTEAGGGNALLEAVRSAIDGAKLEATPAKSGFAVSIGTQLGGASDTPEEEEVVEDDDFDDE